MLEASASEGKELILLGDFNCDVSGRHPLQAGFADLAIELNLSIDNWTYQSDRNI